MNIDWKRRERRVTLGRIATGLNGNARPEVVDRAGAHRYRRTGSAHRDCGVSGGADEDRAVDDGDGELRKLLADQRGDRANVAVAAGYDGQGV